ncbi:MAG: helix-turn-helix transcriptional regulator [Planctomycetes bacterium]|nr:helix-turn-helix transcriptional regulator [Planctomycetota bacterium]
MINFDSRGGMETGMEHRDSARERLTNIYANMISSIGLTGREIARLSGTRPQYISDIKRRQRPLSQEMFMRTLLGLFGKYKWLISGDLPTDTQRIITLYPHISDPERDTPPLPVFQRPFMGPKMTVEDWDGNFVCVASPVREMAEKMHEPYILHLPFNDRTGRLKKGDYLLVDQTASAEASFVLIKSGWGVKLVRKVEQGFEDVESGEHRFDPDVQIIGNVSMLLMGSL